MQTIIGIDHGTKGGWACNESYGTIDYSTPYQFYKDVKEIFDLHKPTVCIIPYPVRYYYALIKGAKMMGIIEVVAELYKCKVIEVNDTQCKKAVLGKGKISKEDIMQYFGVDNEHIADALMFRKYGEINFLNM